MKGREAPNNCLVPDELLREYFPYARLNAQDEYVIPKRHIDAFVKKYSEIADSREHLEKLAAYRAQRVHAPLDSDGE